MEAIKTTTKAINGWIRLKELEDLNGLDVEVLIQPVGQDIEQAIKT